MTIREYILEQSGCKDFAGIKAKLLKLKKYEYGCYSSNIKCKGFELTYTSNDNCFASFLICLQGVGMVNSLGLDKDSITQAGHNRGVSSHYISDKALNQPY